MRHAARLRESPLTAFGVPVLGGAVVPFAGQHWWVDPNYAVNTPKRSKGHGKSEDYPLATLALAEDRSQSGDAILVQGNIREEAVTFSNLKFDRKVIGLYGRHHPDQPTSAYHPKSSMIRPPASPTAATGLIAVRGRGTEFHNIAFDCPVDAEAVLLASNALSGVSEYDASHAKFIECLFTSGYRGIRDAGGVINVMIERCIFRIISETGGAAIVNTSTSVRVPQYWSIKDSFFPGNAASGGNECHIDAPLSGSEIIRNRFGRVEGTALYIDLTGGDDNIVTKNLLAGSYDTSDYVAGTNDEWGGNYTADISGNSSVDASGLTIAAPAAP